MPEWDAEVAIDEKLVRALLADQFPELDARSARLLGEGWDNSVWIVEEAWAFRFPRRAVAIPGVRRELELLPKLAPLLPAPVPEPRFVGVPCDRFPWPFFGAPLLGGVEPAEADLSDGSRGKLGAELGRFLRVLHDLDLDVELPLDPLGRADMTVRVPRARENIEWLRDQALWTPPAAVERILARAEALPLSEEHMLVHGDLHLRHVLVAHQGIAAVIDWGDACRADPCIDLMLVWSLLDPSARGRFVTEYGPVTEEQLLRARVLALLLDSMLARYATDKGHANVQREALASLRRTLIDWD